MPSRIVYLALGTNLGERTANLRRAIQSLPPAVTVLAESPVYATPPWGVTGQPNFLNMALKGETRLPPLGLLKRLKQLEGELGRVPSVRYGPRLIDIDILFYADLVLDTPQLTLPHPRLHERAFVLVPLNDIAPNLHHPRLGKTVREMLTVVDTTGVKLYESAS
ncbi:MAG: 2-amino-4-hydroxy-6-hydroxymethyldihydropteridine diphosphokinase [Chloroflexota bacterium]